MEKQKVILIILDGWGHGPKTKSNAVFMAHTPVMDALYSEWPNSELVTSGEAVGLPAGQMGNSEVGHLNIGAGRIVYQELVRINKAIRDKETNRNPVLLQLFREVKEKNNSLHLIGLVSDGGIHSHIDHLVNLCELSASNGLQKVFIHAFTDGRDTDPKSGSGFIAQLEKRISTTSAKVASVCGRYYAMDRDKRWERVKLAYDLLTKGIGKKSMSATEAIEQSYADGVTDEFILPAAVCDTSGNPLSMIQPGDAVISFNFRTDRCREITTVLTQKDMPEQGMKTIPLHYVTMTNYDDSFKNIEVVFHKDNLQETLGEVISKNKGTQLRIAETEKYPHVTFFFSGGREQVFDGEKRIMVPSPKVATYDLQPEMSAREVKDAVINDLLSSSPDFICLNFANPDMVGHTGVFDAEVKALECVDHCLGEVLQAARSKNYAAIVIADHGNAEYMKNEDGSPNTAHTTNPVPCILVNSQYKKIENGKLADLAPTILKLMGLEIPMAMDGKVLVQTK